MHAYYEEWGYKSMYGQSKKILTNILTNGKLFSKVGCLSCESNDYYKCSKNYISNVKYDLLQV